MNISHYFTACLLGAALTLNGFGESGTTIEDFNAWAPSGSPYEGWASGTITTSPSNCTVSATGFGGVYQNLGNLDVSGRKSLRLDAEIVSGKAGLVLVLGDADGTVNNYAWYGLNPRRHVLEERFEWPTSVAKEGSVPGLDLSKLQSLHVQVDEGKGDNAYVVTFNDLSAVGRWETPPPAQAPPASTRPKVQANYKTQRDIEYWDEGEANPFKREACRLDLYYPEGVEGFPTVVWLHAGGLVSGQRYIPGELMEKGFAVAAVDYRLAPKAKAPEYIEDAAAATAWVMEKIERVGGSPDKVVVAGASAGGYLSLMVGLDKSWLAKHEIDANRLAGIVSLSGHTITHFTVREEQGISKTVPVVDQLAPLHHVRGDAPPMLLVTGDRELELLGRYEETAYLWRMLKVVGHKNVELHEIKGKDHGGVERPGHQFLLGFMERFQN